MSAACGKILIVEDDDNIRLVAQMSLEDDWQVLEASSGEMALEVAAHETLDVVLLDVMMPGMDGLETMARLRQMHGFAETPIIFMTAKVQTHEVEGYVKLGAAGLIPKPFDPMKLSGQILEFAKLTSRAGECSTVC
jgi:CheY-like chemotaxis protein